jgi:hypothetical protein
MDAMVRMDNSVQTVEHDLAIVVERIHQLRNEVGALDTGRYGDARILRMMELLADVQARAEGISVFVESCRQRAHKHERPAEDIDLWM